MSIITSNTSIANGPILQAYIGLTPQRIAALKKANQPIPAFQQGYFQIDTGASGTCIDPSVIAPLGITPKDYIEIQTPSTNGNPLRCPVYDINLLFTNNLASTQSGPTQYPYLRSISVVGAELRHQGIHGLIGRDVLEHCLFVYNGQLNSYTIAW